ncbi:MAG: hypothetical protein NVS1B7_7000 [Candidatus Saccharimonadales bacterium]
MIIIIYKAEAAIEQRIRRTNQLGLLLHDGKIPIRYPLDPRIITFKTQNGVRCAGLYNYLEGATIPWESYTMNHLKLLGWSMSDLHVEMNSIQLDFPSTINEYLHLINEWTDYFKQAGVQKALVSKLKLQLTDKHKMMSNMLRQCNQLPCQLLHMDFVRGNVLFDTSNDNYQYRLSNYSVSGVIDFEKASCGPVVMDVARTLAFLLVDCKYKSESAIRRYFIDSGYNKRGHSRVEIDKTMESMIELFLLHDFYKFLQHNPYESLAKNEHYARTKLLLIKRGLLTPVDDRMVASA